MKKAFTVYWTPDGWAGIKPGQPLRGAAIGETYRGKASIGDRIFITNVLRGRVRVLGAFTVGEVVEDPAARPEGFTWDMPIYLIADPATATALRLTDVPDAEVDGLVFLGSSPSVKRTASGRVDGQALRNMRALTPASADVLEKLVAVELPAHKIRLPASQLIRATPDLFWWAIGELQAGRAPHDFGPSTDFDLLTDEGERLAPKAVFGVALAKALGQRVGPEHFTAGTGSTCFRLLAEAGYQIVPKDAYRPAGASSEQFAADQDWQEGGSRLVSHLRRERKPAAARAKKAAFINQHGRLFCERCRKDPTEQYGIEDGLACIEVHHAETAVAEMEEGARTKLADLQCVCANCHRVLHHAIRRQRANGAEGR